MGESTSRLCVSHFVRGVLSCDDIRNKYFRKMSAADAKRIEKMHHDVHGIQGMAFSLDCSHYFGANVLQSIIVRHPCCYYKIWLPLLVVVAGLSP